MIVAAPAKPTSEEATLMSAKARLKHSRNNSSIDIFFHVLLAYIRR